VRDHPAAGEKLVLWAGSAKRDLLQFPTAVVDEIGTAISVAQFGGMHPSVKPWKGAGPGVMEIVEDHDRATYRAVYTVRFLKAIYVLHCFQKKSPTGIKTAQRDVDLVSRRLQSARGDYEVRYGQGKT
jgi:phage-related protein